MNSEAVKSIHQALHILDNAVSESSDEIKQVIAADYKKLKQSIAQVRPELKDTLRSIKDRSFETLHQVKDRLADSSEEAIKKVDQSAHQHPWVYVSTAAIASLLIGFLIGKKSTE